MSKLVIRPAVAADRESWIRLRFALWPECPLDKQRIEIEQLLASDGVVLLADDPSVGPVGFAEVSIRHEHVSGVSTCPVPYLEGWFVDERFRHRGVGRALIAAVERWACERGFRELASDAELHNARSLSLHAALGFREVERVAQFVKRLA